MILPGRTLLTRLIIQNIKSPSLQVQPCGIDLTLKRILTFNSAGTVDLDNTHRQTASTVEIPLPGHHNATSAINNSADHTRSSSTINNNNNQDSPFTTLAQGTYLVEFNETVSVPLDVIGQIFVRSSLFRSGVAIHAGVMDAGYTGAVGALMQVFNAHGVRVAQDARLAQMVFHCMSESVEEGYKGVYQGSGGI
ncbi:putative dUTP diphosphatase Dut [Aspergillus affinis]|uniref:putative dUTP diphosphatase Dut n=1 Tax=Aspergillus affinis TaxID=1070780 RepID=UPI0022FF2A2C|nr:deoxyuridine 5'-triphosphate nucleotidohydrolase [Aspergillus affinis]KAI9037145.1 deoxyuridine 5'-triphosphate nucleotidohydrolase [Aspergillus affinis]